MSKLKEKLFNTKAYRGEKNIVDIEGVKVEIRTPKLKDIQENAGAVKKGSLKQTSSGLKILTKCVFDPESGEKVFTEHDLERLSKGAAHKGGLINRLLEDVNKLAMSKKKHKE